MHQSIRNRTFDDLEIGQTESLRHRITRSDLRGFVTFVADATGQAVDRELATDPAFRNALSLGGIAVGLLTALIATRLPGPGTRLRGLALTYSGTLAEGDVALAEVRVAHRDRGSGTVTLDVRCWREDGAPVALGEFDVVPPDKLLSRPFGRPVAIGGAGAPDRLDQLEETARQTGSVRMAVVNPVDGPALSGALDSARAGLIEPVLIAPKARLRAVSEAEELDLSGIETVDVADAEAAAEKAAALAAEGQCGGIMKGTIHTDMLLRAALARRELRTARRLSHVFVEDIPGYPRLLFVADAAVNIAPDLATLGDIVRNAVDLAKALGVKRPKVALLSAVENVTEDIPSTVAAAAVCKMADRGEISGADVDGPLALDNAVSQQAARIKNIASPVAGQADILIGPDLEAANILAKDLDHLAGAEAAGIALGLKVPIALTSRADSPRERRASAALAAIMAARLQDQAEDAS